jgi:transposase
MKPHKYPICLSGKEKQELRQLKRAGKTERRLADRARTILWTADWVAVDEIARRLDCHRQTVINWRGRYRQQRQQGLSVREALLDRARCGRPSKFSPLEVTQIKAVACEQPAKLGVPLSRFSLSEVTDWVVKAKIVPTISGSSVWRLLHQAALRPWFYRAWLFPRDPAFVTKAGVVLDLYQGFWQGQRLGSNDFIFSADEKTGIQVLSRAHPTWPPQPGQPGRYEFEYDRHGTWAYLAALNVLTGQVSGRVDEHTGIAPFGQLVDQIMQQEPYHSARRVFWIVDGGPSHHPNTAPTRLQKTYGNLILVHVPTHASWLNQVELYFSILTRKALTPMDLAERAIVKERILGFESRYNLQAKPFNWKFTRQQLEERLKNINRVSA